MTPEREPGSTQLDRPCFAVGGAEYTWRDVVDVAVAWSDWSRIEEQTREGIAARLRLDGEPEALSREDVEQAAKEFRYERRLLAADEVVAWLSSWNVGTGDWYEYLRRSILRDRWRGQLPWIAPAPDEIDAFVEIEAICSGALEELAWKVAERAAAHAALAGADEKPNPARLEVSFAAFEAEHVDEAAIERALDANRLDWVQLEVEELRLAGEAAAREALLSIEEGRAATDVARDAGTTVGQAVLLLAEADPAYSSALLGAQEGDVVGPLALTDGYSILRIVARTSPSADDPVILERARQAALAQALEREVTNRVRWYERD